MDGRDPSGMPGTTQPRLTRLVLVDALAAHPNEKIMAARVGTVIVFNGHVWHNSTQNRSQTNRAGVTSFWSKPPHTFLDATPNAETTARLSEAALRLFPGSPHGG